MRWKNSKAQEEQGEKGLMTMGNREGFNSGIKILDEIVVLIPLELLYACDYIAAKAGGDEFSILTKIASRRDNEITLSEAFYIPKQKVGPAHIDYISDPNSEGYEVVIHRHPDGMETFSATDRDYINQNFRLSLLYTKARGFVNGIFNMKAGDRYLVPIRTRSMIVRPSLNIDLRHICKSGGGTRRWYRGEWIEEEYDYETGQWKEPVKEEEEEPSDPSSAASGTNSAVTGRAFDAEKNSTVAIGFTGATAKFDSSRTSTPGPEKEKEVQSERLSKVLSEGTADSPVLESINKELEEAKTDAEEAAKEIYQREEESFSPL